MAVNGVACGACPLEIYQAKSISPMASISPYEKPEQDFLYFWCKIINEEWKLWSSQWFKDKFLRWLSNSSPLADVTHSNSGNTHSLKLRKELKKSIQLKQLYWSNYKRYQTSCDQFKVEIIFSNFNLGFIHLYGKIFLENLEYFWKVLNISKFWIDATLSSLSWTIWCLCWNCGTKSKILLAQHGIQLLIPDCGGGQVKKTN